MGYNTHIRKAVVAPNHCTTQLGRITIGLQSKNSMRKAEELAREVIYEDDEGHGYLCMRRERSRLGTQLEALQELK